jgi:hypothetical protein
MTIKVSRATAVDLSTKRLTALRAYVKTGKTEIGIGGVNYKLPQVIAVYQDAIDSRQAVDTKRAEMTAAMTARAAAETKRHAADNALKPWVIGQFGPNSQEAIDFGFPPRKTPTRTPEEKVQAVAQAKATREARGTMGKKERLKIKGVVPSPAATSTTTTPTPANPATAPAAPATSAPTASQPLQAAPSAPTSTNVAMPSGAAPQVTNGVASH